MAFHLHDDESVGRGVRRLARKQLAGGAAALSTSGPPAPRVHEARKSIKKVRALLRLLQADGAPKLGRPRRQLRQLSRALSPLRDAAAMHDSLDRLRTHDPALLTADGWNAAHRELTARGVLLHREATRRRTWEAAARRLRKLATRAKTWTSRHAGAGLVASGLEGSHRRARKALARAERNGGADDFHELRKALKTLWYQLRLLETRGQELGGNIAVLHQAEAALGDDHNIAVLCDYMKRCARDERISIDLDRLASVALSCQESLRRSAVSAVRPLLDRGSRSYARAVKHAWKQPRLAAPARAVTTSAMRSRRVS
jgi:CHAD domain-containing protein